MLTRHLAAVLALAAVSTAYGEPATSLAPLSQPAPSTAQAAARESPALPLDEALGIAAGNNPLLRGARADADASSGTFMQAGARPNPQISLLQEGFGGTDRTSTALLNQTVELGGKRQARLDVASYGREVALASLDARGAALRADVIAAFYGLLAAQRQLRVAQESAEIAARSAELAEKRARAGKVSPVEATKARVAATGVQIEQANAATRLTIAAEKLANVTGSPLVRGRPVSGDIESVPAIGALSQLLPHLSDAPLARAAKAETLRANAAISVERAKRIPDVTFSVGMKRVVTGGVPGNQAVVGVSIPLPIFDTNKGALLESVHKAGKASADFDSETARLQLELTQAYAHYERSNLAARRLKTDVLPAAREALDAMSRGYELGKFAFLDVLDAQRTLFQSQSQYVQALADAHFAYADIGRIVGVPLADVSSRNTADPSPRLP